MQDSGAMLAFSSLCGEVARLFRARLAWLTLVGLAIFVPLGLAEASLSGVSEVEGSADPFAVIEAAAAAAAGLLISLFGWILYAAIVSASVVDGSQGPAIRFGAFLRRLPLGRLLAADLAYALLVAGGLLALVVPGLIFMAWFALVAPVIEIEQRRFLDAFRRSRSLVQPRFWLVLGITMPLILSSELISELAVSGGFRAFGDSFAGEWAGSVLAEMLTAPIFALFVVVLFLRLREDSGTPAVE